MKLKKYSRWLLAILMLMQISFLYQNCGEGFSTQSVSGATASNSLQNPTEFSGSQASDQPGSPTTSGQANNPSSPSTGSSAALDANDMLTWAHSQLPATSYVSVHAEKLKCNPNQAIQRYYQQGLGRTALSDEIQYHLNNGASLKTVRQHISLSPEFQNVNIDHSTFTVRLYRLMFARTPSNSEIQYYLDRSAQGQTRLQMVQNFHNSNEHLSGPDCHSADFGWGDVADFHQPFKSMVDYSKKLIFWRKDDMANFYGEIFKFDDNFIYLRTETFPFFKGFDPENSWDARIYKFRLFALNPSEARPGGTGRLISNRRVNTNWSHSQTLNTYACYDLESFKNSTCRLFQNGVQDSRIFIERYNNFSTNFDGVNPDPRWTVSSEFQNFDEVVVWNQEMNSGTARERFFFAKKNGKYYGIVRWDNAVINPDTGRLEVIERTIGLNIQSNPAFSFSGMETRAAHD